MLNFKLLSSFVPTSLGGTVAWSDILKAIPQLALLAQCRQDPYYHAEGDVLTHTMMVVAELVSSSDFQEASIDERFILFYAAVLHDIAKPGTTVIDEQTGRIGQPGHSRRGAIDARVLLWKAGVPFALREHICRIIQVHQVPFFLVAGSRSGQTPEFLVRKLSHELDLRLLGAVAEADMRGRHYEKKEDCLVDIELFRELAREEGCYGQPFKFPDSDTQMAYLRGAAISAEHAYYRPPGADVTLMVGLPASGKDTRVESIRDGRAVLSFDDARAELKLKHGTSAGAAVHLVTERARHLLRRKEPFILNGTHISGLLRKKSLDLLYAYGARVEVIYLEQPEAVIMARNKARDTTLTNKAIEGMLLRWEVPLPTEADAVIYDAAVAGA